MSSSLFWSMKRGDLFPSIQIQFFNPDDTPRNLSGRVVTFRMGGTDEAPMVSGEAAPVDLSLGIVEYQWQSGDTDLSGTFRAEFVLDGPETFPKSGYIIVSIEDGVGV